MSAKSVCLGGLVAALLGAGLARAQTSTSPTVGGQMGGLETGPVDPGSIINDSPRLPGNVPFYSGPQSLQTPGTEAPPQEPVRATLSSWMLYPRAPGCCGPTGAFGPIVAELFMDTGAAFNVSGGIFGHALSSAGWDIEGGGRTLFYNPQCTAAWTVALGVTNIYNQGNDSTVNATLINYNFQGTTIPALTVGVRDLNRTYANFGLGRDWYLWGQAHVDGISEGELPNWRVGCEVGGRYGTAKLEATEVTNITETIYGTYVALYTDVEYPWHCCILTAGLRMEYGYTWCDILQQQNRTDVEDLNVLLTVGIRF
jgi:hypothetical protein